MLLFVMRHGETVAQSRYCGRTDVALSARGIEQTETAIKTLLKEPIQVVFSSGLKRTDDAAAYFLSQRQVPHVVEPDFAEMDFGECENLPPEEIAKNHPEIVAAWRGEAPLAYPGGESVDTLCRRVFKGVKHVTQRGDNALVICHNGVIRAIHMALSGADFDSVNAQNAEIFRFELP